jgi:hypothetical protein
MPDLPGIGFEGKSDLYAEMRALASLGSTRGPRAGGRQRPRRLDDPAAGLLSTSSGRSRARRGVRSTASGAGLRTLRRTSITLLAQRPAVTDLPAKEIPLNGAPAIGTLLTTAARGDAGGPRLLHARYRSLGTALRDACAVLLIGAAGGALFYLIGAPLPWTLGSLSAAAVVAVAGGPWLMPAGMRELARPVVGVLADSAFTPEVVAAVAEWAPAIVFVAVYSLGVTLLGWLFFCCLDR